MYLPLGKVADTPLHIQGDDNYVNLENVMLISSLNLLALRTMKDIKNGRGVNSKGLLIYTPDINIRP